MAKKILLASGCSYTDKNYISFDKEVPEDQRGGWKFWPEIMANKLDLKCVNVARSGRGADFIFDETIKHILMYGDLIDTVVIMWSGSDRSSFYTYELNPILEIYNDSLPSNDKTTFDPFIWMDQIGIGKINKKFWDSPHFNKKVYYKMMENQLIKMVSLIEICKAKNIKLIMGQGLVFFNFSPIEKMYTSGTISENAYISKQNVLDYFFKSPFFPYLEKNKKHIIGWPFWSQFGGRTFEDFRFGKEQYFISSKDRHPNEKGQQLFAEYFIERHGELYG